MTTTVLRAVRLVENKIDKFRDDHQTICHVCEAIEEALQRIKTGEYGFCDECGDQIDQKRLMVMPLAQLCITCQQNEERLGNISSFSRLPQQSSAMRDD